MNKSSYNFANNDLLEKENLLNNYKTEISQLSFRNKELNRTINYKNEEMKRWYTNPLNNNHINNNFLYKDDSKFKNWINEIKSYFLMKNIIISNVDNSEGEILCQIKNLMNNKEMNDKKMGELKIENDKLRNQIIFFTNNNNQLSDKINFEKIKNLEQENEYLKNELSKYKLGIINNNIKEDNINYNDYYIIKNLEKKNYDLNNDKENIKYEFNKLSIVNKEFFNKINKLNNIIEELEKKLKEKEYNNILLHDKFDLNKDLLNNKDNLIEKNEYELKTKMKIIEDLKIKIEYLKKEKFELKEKNFKIIEDYDLIKKNYLNKITELEATIILNYNENKQLNEKLVKNNQNIYLLDLYENKTQKLVLENNRLKQDKDNINNEKIILENKLDNLLKKLNEKKIEYDNLFKKFINYDYIEKDYYRISSLNESFVKENQILKRDKQVLIDKANNLTNDNRELNNNYNILKDKFSFINGELEKNNKEYINYQKNYSKLITLNEKFSSDYELIKRKCNDYQIIIKDNEKEILNKIFEIKELKKKIVFISLELKKCVDNKKDYLFN